MTNTFALNLYGATASEYIESVRSFVGEDATGSFGIQAGHARFMTALVFGLARFADDTGNWRYVAMPGGLLYFRDNILSISTRRFLLDSDYTRISTALSEQLLADEDELRQIKQSLRRMEDAMFRRLWEMRRGGGLP